MYIKVEPSGCIVAPDNQEKREQIGCWVQIRFDFFPEPTDLGFDVYKHEHYVHVPVDWEDYKQWVVSLPRSADGTIIFPNPDDPYDYPGERHWIYNPLVSHLIWLEPDVSDDEILNIGKELREVYKSRLEQGASLKMPAQRLRSTIATPTRLAACEAKRQHIANAPLEVKAAKAKI